MGEYAPYVIAAYAITGGAVAALVAWVVFDRRAARSALRRAERAAGKGENR